MTLANLIKMYSQQKDRRLAGPKCDLNDNRFYSVTLVSFDDVSVLIEALLSMYFTTIFFGLLILGRHSSLVFILLFIFKQHSHISISFIICQYSFICKSLSHLSP